MTTPVAVRHDDSYMPDNIRLGLRNIYIFPTSSGWIYLGTMLLLLLCAINYSSNLLHAMVFFFCGLFFVCMLHTYRSLWGLRLEPGPQPDNTFAGSDVVYSFAVHNDANDQRHGITGELQFTSSSAKGRSSNEVQSLPGYSRTMLTITAPAGNRGWLKLDTLRIGSVYPLGLFRAWTRLQINRRSLIYPAAFGNIPLPPANNIAAEQEHGARTSGHDEYEGLKPYYPGAPLRDIHWKKSLQDDIFVHDFSGHDDRVWILDFAQTPNLADDEEKLSQLCMWVMILHAEKQCYGLQLPGGKVEPGFGEEHNRRCLEALALLPAQPQE